MRHQMSVGMSNLFITGNIPEGLHHARNELSTDGTVQSADEVILQAGQCVLMDKGFSTPADADFTAEIKTQPVPQFIYYLYDHLGNTRVTYSVDLYVDVGVDAVQVRRTVESATDYYPYGKALRTYGKERYQSTYHERDVESGFDYRGARFYDGDVVRFNSLDPLAADYPGLSDYSYVAGNPVFFVDPDGRQIYIGDYLYKYEENREWSGDESQHLKDAITALDKLYEEGSLKLDIINAEGKVTNVDVLQALIDADEKIYIKGIGEGKTAYAKTLKNSGDVAGGNVYWNSRTGIVFGGTNTERMISVLGGKAKGVNSPMTVLGHELVHLYNAFDNYDAFSKRHDDTKCCGTTFPNKEEKYTTTLSNQFTEFPRTSYNFYTYITKSPTEITPDVDKTTNFLRNQGVSQRNIDSYKAIIKAKKEK